MINGFKKFGCRGRLFAGAALMALFAGGLAAPTAAFADPSDGQPENGWPLSATITVGGSYGWDPPGTTSMDPDDPVEVDTCEPVTFYYFLYNMLGEGNLSDVTITDGDVSIYVGSIGEGDEHDRQATIDLDPGPFDRTLNVTGSYRWETLGGDYETRYFTTTTHFYGVGLPCEQQAPIAGDASTTINPDETATLTPEVTPGSGAITTATFDDDSTTKNIPGEGRWTIEVTDVGEIVVTFTPEPDYDGPVIPQEYTVIDENGLTASGTLSVTIVHSAIALEKGYTVVDDANDNGVIDPGDVVRWTFTVTNTGNLPLNNIAVDDPLLDELGIAVNCNPPLLEVKASTVCVSGEYEITEADAEAGSIRNVATVSGALPAQTPGDPEDPVSPPSEVEILVNSSNPAADPLDSPKDGTPTELPVTGGATTPYMIAVSMAALLLTGGTLLLIRRRRSEEAA